MAVTPAAWVRRSWKEGEGVAAVVWARRADADAASVGRGREARMLSSPPVRRVEGVRKATNQDSREWAWRWDKEGVEDGGVVGVFGRTEVSQR